MKTMLLVISVSLTLSGCGNTLRENLAGTWQMTSSACNGVADATIKNGLVAGGAITLYFEESNFTLTRAGNGCSHIEQGTFITLPGETGLSMTYTGQVGCTPTGCSVTEFGLSSSTCTTALTSAASPGVTFRDDDDFEYIDLTYNLTDCDAGGVDSDTRVDTYRLVSGQ